MIQLSVDHDRLVLDVEAGDLAPRHESQLAFWGFVAGPGGKRFVSPDGAASGLTERIVSYFADGELEVELAQSASELLAERTRARKALEMAREAGRCFKSGAGQPDSAREFLAFVSRSLPRKLKEHQLKAALHLLAAENGANFSVPGSGKTTVVLSVFEWLRRRGVVDALFVVGPPSCFGPWRHEYEETLGYRPRFEVLAGGDIEERRSRYEVNRQAVPDLLLTSFQTLLRDASFVRVLFEHQGVRFFLVIDEAHYIKRLEGAWAAAALDVAGAACRRCILTGTPFPRGFSDAFNLFDVLWPDTPPISQSERNRIAFLTEHHQVDEAVEVMNESVGPLFYRVRKQELGLTTQQFNEPTLVRMKEHERLVYDHIVGRIRAASQEEYFRDVDAVMRLRRGRMMRLRQCLSYTGLLGTAIEDYGEDLLREQRGVADVVRRYDDLESPAKLDALCERVIALRREGEKVVVWSNFVGTLELIESTLIQLSVGVRLIYGGTPVEASSFSDDMTREAIIREFLRAGSGVDVLVANPAACAESISLHKACSHAVYYDLSYNCAQYLQSLDRIHRVGGSEEVVASYDFLLYENTIDGDILRNVREKAERMSRIVDQEYPIYGLDMFADEDDVEAYERIFHD